LSVPRVELIQYVSVLCVCCTADALTHTEEHYDDEDNDSADELSVGMSVQVSLVLYYSVF
jgi:hypothetical protein